MANSHNADSAPDVDSLSFEDAFRRLGEVAESLENGGLTLAEATARYEEGMRLVKRCNELLDDAQLKITNLKDAFNTYVGRLDWEEDEA